MLRFNEIENLITLVSVPALLGLFFLLIRWRKKAIKRIGDPMLVQQLFRGYSSKLFSLKFIFGLLAAVMASIALADLAEPGNSADIKRTGTDVMIALDVSNSMFAEDIKPNRLERAKQLVTKLVDKLPDNKIGIVIFAGKAYLQMPMTIDHSAAKMYLASASPDDVSTQGTVISDALKMCNAAFDKKEKRYKSIVVITDGEDHDDEAVKVAKQLVEGGVTVNTIGIGSQEGAPIKIPGTNDFKTDADGNTVISKVNEQVLREIAENGKGIYQYFTNADEVASNLQRQFNSVEQSTVADSSFISYIHYYWIFLIAALIFLVVEAFIPDGKRAIMKAGAFVLFTAFFSFSAQAQNVNNQIASGNTSYNNRDYIKAAAAFQSALNEAPKNSIAAFNLGNALFKIKKPDEAVTNYDRVIQNSTDRSVQAKAYYNKGVVYQSRDQLPQCIDAYKKALRIDPMDEEARQNLQRALKKQQQNQQQNQDQQKNKNQNQQNNNQQQPKPKMSQEEAEERLKSLSEHEKGLQNRLKKVKAVSPERPEKDW
ncbi:hypothetical protein BH09BAC2_BH09BAC2_01710 [soil metagenome]